MSDPADTNQAAQKLNETGDARTNSEPASKSNDESSKNDAKTSSTTKKVAEGEKDLRYLLSRLSTEKAPKPEEKKHEFWSTQPVPQFGQSIAQDVNQAIEPDKEKVRQDPFSLPTGFHWDTLDVMNEATLAEIYHLLKDHYVEDDDAMFRFNYSKDFLRWALTPPGWLKFWHVGLRANNSNKLVGFISGVPATIAIRGAQKTDEGDKVEKRMSEINFLCVHKKLRSKRVAVVLIKEITRRCNEKGIFQAVYTAGTLLPRPVVTTRYHHRNINCQKLVDIKFSFMSANMNMKRMKRLYQLPEDTSIPGLRKLEEGDLPQVCQLLNNYLSKFHFHPVYDEAELLHWLHRGQELGVMTAYVVEGKEKNITDLISFYVVPSTVVNHSVHSSLNAVYAYFNVATSVSLEKLMSDALVLAEKGGADVFNALDIMDNTEFLKPLKFGVGDGQLNYYIYNWMCPTIQPNQNGLVLM